MHKTHVKALSTNLRKYRRARGLSQKEAAQILGFKSASMISRWEKGACLPCPGNICKLAALYRIMVDALLADWLAPLREEVRAREQELLKAGLKAAQPGREPAPQD